MKGCRIWGLLLCLLLTGCGGERPPGEAEAAERPPVREEQQPPVREEAERPPAGEAERPEKPVFRDWREAYIALLEEKAERVRYLQNYERPDYDPNTVDLEISQMRGHYTLYDVEKDGVPELLFSCHSGWETEVYAWRNGEAVLLEVIPTRDAAFYSWPEENAVAMNWARMGGHTVTKISIVDGKLVKEVVLDEFTQAENEAGYTDIGDVVPGGRELWAARSMMDLPEPQALTLPVVHYGKDRAPRPIDPERDRQARTAIEAALNGEAEFYGVTADGFGGDTGWITMEDYLKPGGITPYTYYDTVFQLMAVSWEDFNGDGQSEALVTVNHSAEEAAGGDWWQVVFAWQEDTVYAYCLNYMSFWNVEGGRFVNRYPGLDGTYSAFCLDFDREQVYRYTP